MLQHLLDKWAETFEEYNLKVDFHQLSNQLTAVVDKLRLEWALEAILLNAGQYSPQGGTLDVTVSQLESAVVIQFIDEGLGISGEDLPHVFKRFYRGKPTDSDDNLLDVRGLGQGLYIVKSVVEAHNGRVWVDSVIGEGSEFTVLLPLTEANT